MKRRELLRALDTVVGRALNQPAELEGAIAAGGINAGEATMIVAHHVEAMAVSSPATGGAAPIGELTFGLGFFGN